MAYSEFIDEVEQGQVSDVTIQGNNISGHLADGRAFTTYAPNDPGLVNRLEDRGVSISAAPEEEPVHPLVSILISWFPMLLLIGEDGRASCRERVCQYAYIWVEVVSLKKNKKRIHMNN